MCCSLVLPHYFFCFHFLTVPLHALLLIFSSLMFWFYFLILMDIILHYHIMLYIHYCIYCSNIYDIYPLLLDIIGLELETIISQRFQECSAFLGKVVSLVRAGTLPVLFTHVLPAWISVWCIVGAQ